MKSVGAAVCMAVGLCLARPAPGADQRQIVELWPGKAPDETGDLGPEKVRLSPKLTRKEVEVTEPTRLVTNVIRPTLTIYRPAKDRDTGTAVLICPGGGYWDLYWELEGEEVAAWLNSHGVTGIVLKYRVPRRPDEPKGEPARRPLQDAQRAVRLVRSKAREWGLDPKRIGIVGFSAGGHLAVATATGFEKRNYDPVDAVDQGSCRPDFAIAVYPGYLKAKDKDALVPGLSVPADTPPIFLAHGGADFISPPEHSLVLYRALRRAGIPAELHIYAGAAHDFGVRKVDHPCSTWTTSCIDWMRSQGFLTSVRPPEGAQAPGSSETYCRLKAHLDAVPAIDTHDHLWPFERLPGYVETEHGKGMNLSGIWRNSYYTWVHPLTPWTPGMKFDDWWAKARHDFDDARAATFYRYQAVALRDLYGVDFDRITDAEARDLDARIFRNYLDRRWLYEVVTERANIELMFNDPYWVRYDLRTDYPFGVFVLNVTPLVHGHHPAEFKSKFDDPYAFARERGLDVRSLDDYLTVLDRLFAEAKEKGAACLKTTLAYERTLEFARVPRERAVRAFSKKRSELSDEDAKAFEDFVMWHLVGLSAKYGLPFQIHTGDARLQGSNPMLLVDLIQANPKTKFILFHGGYPWVGETGAIVMRHGTHVWVDSVWLPTISYTMAKRAFHEWLDVMPSNRIMWGADCNHAEGIYGATELTRRCLAEVLAERVDRGDLAEADARRIGQQVLRDNALALFPQLQGRLWKGKGRLRPEPAPGPGGKKP